jgi:hypothetical protein
MMPANDCLYVYALAGPGPPHRFTVLGRRLRRLSLGEISAIVERRPPPDVTTDEVRRQHEIVTRLASREPAILPARFGSSADEPSLRSLISMRRKEIVAALENVRGCAQMTVRIFGASDPPRDDRVRARSGTEFMQRRLKRMRHVPEEVAIVRGELGSWVREERVAAGERDGLVTVFHLVAHRDLDDYRGHAARLQATLAPRTASVSGPWPAFAFAPELF